MHSIVFKASQVAKVIIRINFCASVVVLMAGCLLSLTPTQSVFNFNEDIYGEMAGSLRIMMLYLGVTEVLICLYCLFSKKAVLLVIVGAFLILMIGSLEFYGRINNVEIDPDFVPFLVYTGLSHIVFGVIHELSKVKSLHQNPGDVY